jgi:hypothetical protein
MVSKAPAEQERQANIRHHQKICETCRSTSRASNFRDNSERSPSCAQLIKIGPMTQLRARTYRHLGNQVQQTSLLWLCPLFITTYSGDGEAQTGIAGFPGSQTTTNPILRLLVLGASWLDGAIACFWGRGRWTGSRLCYPPPGAGPGMKWGLAKPEFRPRLRKCSNTGAGACLCALSV